MKVLLGAGFAWAALTALACAEPQESDIVVEEVAVPFGDLNLDSEAGAAVMLRRLERGARKACGGYPGRAPLEITVAFRRCFDEALSDAVAQLDAPVVSAFYEGRWAREPVRVASR